MAQKAGLWQKLMRKGSNQQNCGFIVGCYESVRLNTEQTKVSSHSFNTTRQLLGFVVRRKLSFFGYTIRDGGCKVSGKRRRGRPKTSYSNNFTQWMSESMDRITRETRDRAGWRRLVRCAAWAAGRHSWWDRERRRPACRSMAEYLSFIAGSHYQKTFINFATIIFSCMRWKSSFCVLIISLSIKWPKNSLTWFSAKGTTDAIILWRIIIEIALKRKNAKPLILSGDYANYFDTVNHNALWSFGVPPQLIWPMQKP